ncbi:DUF805 domain-containing protein [Ornithobacterium rhinotracheale]|uniref:DUF805 domain-containing protein n=1 Tax=Ornithobacterium rhinotracheale TaxID=28251 RepID=UPI00129CA80D|nr:DUF805 domain-containing protein [Ornithobacterium rhinotracheale]MRJ11303.1 DUF805 domain-containing protein [Ornithobacterium rhinotracheale]
MEDNFRVERAPYWFGVVVILVISAMLASAVGDVGGADAGARAFALIASILIFLISVPRLRDAGLSGWYALWGLAPFGILILMVMCAKPSKENKEGEQKEYKDEVHNEPRVNSQANELENKVEIQKSTPQITNTENNTSQEEEMQSNKSENIIEEQEVAVQEKASDEQEEIQANEFNHFREKLIYDEYKKIYNEYKKLYEENKILKKELQKLKIKENEN